MAETKHPILASDGWPFFFAGLLILLIALKFQEWWIVAFCGVYFISAFLLFRDPHREVPSQPFAVVSPVDGKLQSLNAYKKACLNARLYI